MKKHLLIAVAVSIFGSVAMAASDESTSHFGIQAGASVANANVSPTQASNNRTGLTAGVQLESSLVPGLLYIQPELNFTQKGAKNSSLGGLATTTLNYIELPVQAKVKFNVGGVRPYVLAGPRIGYLVSASSDVAGLSIGRSNFNQFEAGADVGAGLGFALSETSEVFLTAKYAMGFTNVASNTDWKNNGFQFLGGLLF